MMTQEDLFIASKKVVPGGVHSPVRSFKGMISTPRFMASADGAYIKDIDGKDYIDFCMSFGPMILGHRNEKVQKSIEKALNQGWSFGTCEPYSLELAEFLVEKIPFIQQIRFVNSGTEAVMTALRLARGFTKKTKIIKFNGCYHGHSDALLIKAGSGLAGEAEASSGGVPEGVSKDTLILELGDKEAVSHCFQRYKDDIAAIIIEPLPANNGLLAQAPEFIHFLKQISQENGSLFILDEVISGFRIGPTGMAGKLDLVPDLVTYGKIIGGGMPVGAIAGRKDIMQTLAPIGNIYQAGTLSANPLAMIAGLNTLTQLTSENYDRLKSFNQLFAAEFTQFFSKFNNGQFKEYQISIQESLFWIHKGSCPRRAIDISPTTASDFVPLFEILLKKGIYLAPNAYEVGFLSLAHDHHVLKEFKNRLWS